MAKVVHLHAAKHGLLRPHTQHVPHEVPNIDPVLEGEIGGRFDSRSFLDDLPSKPFYQADGESVSTFVMHEMETRAYK